MHIVIGKRILAADDNATNLMLIKELLELDRHEVTAVRTGMQAVEKLSAMEFDLVLLDFKLGDMDGAEVLQLYHASRIDVAPAYFLTADLSEASVARMNESGPLGILRQPTTLKALRQAISATFPLDAAGSAVLNRVMHAGGPARPAQPAVSQTLAEYIDGDTIRTIKALPYYDGYHRDVLTLAASEIEKLVSEVCQLLDGADLRALQKRGLTLYLLSKEVGALRLGKLAESLLKLTPASVESLRANKAVFKEVGGYSVAALRQQL